MHPSERAPQRGVIAVCAHLKVLEHEKYFLARLSPAQRRRDSGTGRGKRREAVGLCREIVELRAAVDFREVLASAALEHETTMDAASRRGGRALDAECTCGIRDCCLQRGEEIRGCDHSVRRPCGRATPQRYMAARRVLARVSRSAKIAMNAR